MFLLNSLQKLLHTQEIYDRSLPVSGGGHLKCRSLTEFAANNGKREVLSKINWIYYLSFFPPFSIFLSLSVRYEAYLYITMYVQ